ncbi:MAG: hypothetical protein M1814_002194 [Vezdaea aestivalis]|nr:MAG: hypothetical protein M1814_002194 [Vezdaea aestivalis]
MFSGILQSQAPARQSATNTISTLSSRLATSTLLEDRRAAILGLRSFSKEYPASVASGALRGLIESLRKDGEDVETVRVVLETLLMLFNPDQSSPEASDDISLWLADEFTQRQDNITVLLDLLDRPEFYSRLYALQILSAILALRPERTQECVFTAPLGISRLVATLDDKREAVKNEGLILLTGLTPSSPELQKLVAFENAFERVFRLIEAEGSLSQGGIIVQDCLSLLANLLRLNVSNQSFFRETGFVTKFALLIKDANSEQEAEGGLAEWARVQRDKNIWGLLAVLRLFLVRGGLGTQANQTSFWKSGAVVQVLKLAFSGAEEMAVRAEALTTCGDLIRGSPQLQEGFAQLQVTAFSSGLSTPKADGQQSNGVPKVFVIDGLLDLCLTFSAYYAFDARLAACECIQAYFFDHSAIKLHFLQRAIEGHSSGEDETANILSTLLSASSKSRISDPYRIWFASVILSHLFYEETEAKSMAMAVSEGDAESGEEVVTCIQTLTGNLIAAMQHGEDERALIGYLMLLCSWLYEDLDAVNDFLGEGSNFQSLVQAVIQGQAESSIVQGLCAVLLGIVYEFSTKDSPIPRATLHPILSSRMGRDQYIDKITKLREHPLLRDFEVLPQGLDPRQSGGLPDVFFDKAFVDFLKDNSSRLVRAIDRDPGIEIAVVTNGVQKGISRELVDSLRTQLDDKNKSLQKAEEGLLTLERKLGQEQADHRRSKEMSVVELSRIKTVNDALHKSHDEQLASLTRENEYARDQAQRQHLTAISLVEAQLQGFKKEADETLANAHKRHSEEMFDLRTSIKTLEIQLEKANKDHLQDLTTAHEDHQKKQAGLEARLKRAEETSEELSSRLKRTEDRAKDQGAKVEKAEASAKETEEARSTAQTELDDLLMVLGDLEEKRAKDKKRLKELGEEVSDAEDEGDEEDDEEVD